MGNETGTFTDTRDGRVYKTVKIGNQVWMAENLAYKSNSGNCWAYDDDESNVAEYGYMYDWETAKEIAPTGWHLPSKEEFEILCSNYGGINDAETIYKALIPSGNSGFSALFGGLRSKGGYFKEKGEDGHFWTANDYSGDGAWELCVLGGSEAVYMNSESDGYGYSVRYIKD